MASSPLHSQQEQVVAMIPARLGSTRFPGKVLADRTGKPLIEHVFSAARDAKRPSRVVIATDDQRVLKAAQAFGAEAVLTRADHPNGTSRLAEAARLLGLTERDIVVNVQGDEPELEPEAIDAAVDALIQSEREQTRKSGGMATIAVPFQPGEDIADPNCVKVVTGQGTVGALYFSRSPVPYCRGEHPPILRHVGLYAYRRGFLETYLALPSTPLERAEQLEQLRALEHGYPIAVAVRPHAAIGIDTPEQYEAFVQRWKTRQTR